jgi:hypothetical protein
VKDFAAEDSVYFVYHEIREKTLEDFTVMNVHVRSEIWDQCPGETHCHRGGTTYFKLLLHQIFFLIF